MKYDLKHPWNLNQSGTYTIIYESFYAIDPIIWKCWNFFSNNERKQKPLSTLFSDEIKTLALIRLINFIRTKCNLSLFSIQNHSPNFQSICWITIECNVFRPLSDQFHFLLHKTELFSYRNLMSKNKLRVDKSFAETQRHTQKHTHQKSGNWNYHCSGHCMCVCVCGRIRMENDM